MDAARYQESASYQLQSFLRGSSLCRYSNLVVKTISPCEYLPSQTCFRPAATPLSKHPINFLSSLVLTLVLRIGSFLTEFGCFYLVHQPTLDGYSLLATARRSGPTAP